MIGDKIIIKPHYYDLSRKVVELFEQHIPLSLPRWAIGIGGESGSGKSVTAYCLARELEKAGFKTLILHQDDYFKLPPKSNHENRVLNPDWVGPIEVKMDLLNQHIRDFLAGAETIHSPEVNYMGNIIGEKEHKTATVRVLLVEGTFALSLSGLQWKVFMGRDYLATREERLQRNREAFDPFIESVLEKEHKIIRPMGATAHVCVDNDYEVIWRG